MKRYARTNLNIMCISISVVALWRKKSNSHILKKEVQKNVVWYRKEEREYNSSSEDDVNDEHVYDGHWGGELDYVAFSGLGRTRSACCFFLLHFGHKYESLMYMLTVNCIGYFVISDLCIYISRCQKKDYSIQCNDAYDRRLLGCSLLAWRRRQTRSFAGAQPFLI